MEIDQLPPSGGASPEKWTADVSETNHPCSDGISLISKDELIRRFSSPDGAEIVSRDFEHPEKVVAATRRVNSKATLVRMAKHLLSV